MSTDVSKIVHICPICDERFGSDKRVRKHVTESEDEQHQGINGFDMDMTVVTKQEDVWDVESEQALHNKIAKAAEYFDDISNEEIAEIASNAEVPKNRVLRVFDDEDIPYDTTGTTDRTTVEDLTEKQYAVLKEWDGKEDTRSFRALASATSRKNQDIDLSETYPRTVLEQYGWLKLPIYDGSEFGDQQSVDGDVTVENSTDEMLHTTKMRIDPTTLAVDRPKDENDSDSSGITQEDMYEAFVDSDVEFTVVPDENDFSVVKKLINAGYEDIAEEVFNS